MDGSQNQEKAKVDKSADQKFCFACGQIIHLTAGACPHCGASQAAPAGLRTITEPESDGVLVPVAGRGLIADQVFCRGCGKSIHRTAPMCPHCGAPQVAVMAAHVSHGQKSRTTAAILAILLGGIGVHKFYLDESGLGILYLLFSWTFIPAIIGLIEGLIYLTMSDERFAHKYG